MTVRISAISIILIGGIASAAAAQEDARQLPKQTLRNTVIQAGSGNSPMFTATLGQLQLDRIANRSVYDLLHDANLRAQIESRIAEPAIRDDILGNDAVASLIDIAQVLITSDASSLTQKGNAKIRLIMAKGTYIDVVLDPASTVGSVRTNSARTAGGQLIPQTLEDSTGHWSALEGDDLEDLAVHIQFLGGTVDHAPSADRGMWCRLGRCTLATD